MSSPLRIACVGCGHGALNEIYERIEVEKGKKHWDSVDCVIVGGDFQTLRNANDAACMSVPPKYRSIGDFHEYYSGARVAPVLTIFCGGNHEAGNYLFELYYGGWVAPNIYYLGAANVLRLGPLRISGMSGIWKPYDYRKHHYERLPYNSEDVSSIYHIRELDVRKLMQVRTQVDIGLSHDWPRGIENHGNTHQLFRKKKFLRDDSEHGRLGNQAAREVLDRLCPAYWFSAHFHTRFALTMGHDGTSLKKTTQSIDEPAEWGYEADPTSKPKSTPPFKPTSPHKPTFGGPSGSSVPENGSVSAWNTFAQTAPQRDRAEAKRARMEFNDPSRVSQPAIKAQQTWKKVIAHGDHRSLVDVHAPIDEQQVKNNDEIDLDSGSESAKEQAVIMTDDAATTQDESMVDVDAPTDSSQRQRVKNTDEINLDSGSESEAGSPPNTEIMTMTGGDAAQDESMVDVNAPTDSSQRQQVKNTDEINLDSDGESEVMTTTEDHVAHEPITVQDGSPADEGVPIAIRDKLPASLSSNVSKLPTSLSRPTQTPPALKVIPEAIQNRVTKFLALDKPGGHDQYLELVEVQPVNNDTARAEFQRPFRLQYDKEWLAITRVFAQELEVGNVTAWPPHHKGDDIYRQAIEVEELWVEANVMKPNLMDVPLNFTQVAPVFDPNVPITTNELPPEYPSPQTEQFCRLIDIPNKFALSDEERAERLAATPRPTVRRDSGWHGGRGHGHGHGHGQRGRYGGRGGGRGRGGHHG
ncbi:Lariat debranching enzyme [Penicillium malachiteum]|uniref:Lariat debranching enzyme n=1 Tax=Penicillium malachiteum TaxID=1324776 RepID=UPI002546F970|nr:Lariat debranching enzyme [Penicillium malachiteum]KAJ5714695.1 Lariat debranching enzyme [Penicillium malachiteum]